MFLGVNKISLNRAVILILAFFMFALYATEEAQAFTIVRKPKPPTKIELPPNANVPGYCPSGLLENHVSICGIAKTIDINKKGSVEYAQEPIEGVTVAAYLGVKYLADDMPQFRDVFKDPNNTGDLIGRIEKLYTYNISNKDGEFVLPVPRSAGTKGMIFLAFFCGDQLKDLYMIDSSKDLPYLPVSLACSPRVTPKTDGPEGIPAPPSVLYDNRTTYTSCEDEESLEWGSTGILQKDTKSTQDPIIAEGLDNTRLGARVTQEMTWTCIPGIMPGEFIPVPGSESISGTPYFHEDDLPGGHILEVPDSSREISRRDLEGFTHSSLGYSFQAISSLNCGVSGCYYTGAPAMVDEAHLYLNQSEVRACNEIKSGDPFPPLNCLGPGIGLAEPGEWEKSYDMQGEVPIYPGITLNEITQPQYSAIGQYIQGILKILTNKFGFVFDDSVLNDPVAAKAVLDSLKTSFVGDKGLLSNLMSTWDSYKKIISSISDIYAALNSGEDLATKFSDAGSAFAKAIGVIFHEAPNLISNFINSLSALKTAQSEIFKTMFPEAASIITDIETNIANLNNLAWRYINAVGTFWDSMLHLHPITAVQEFITFLISAGPDFQDILIGSFKTLGDLIGQVISIMNRVSEIITALQEAIDAIDAVVLPTESSDLFPYSTVLNYRIRNKLNPRFLNRPQNDSYYNELSGFESPCWFPEGVRKSTSSLRQYVAEYPFSVCYGSVLLAEDTYSTEKALFTTTKNLQWQREGSANDPVVSKFLAPGEEVGLQIDYDGTYESDPVYDIPFVGKGYWRIGVVQSMCSFGNPDLYNSAMGAGVVDYPVRAIYGAEGDLRAKPQY